MTTAEAVLLGLLGLGVIGGVLYVMGQPETAPAPGVRMPSPWAGYGQVPGAAPTAAPQGDSTAATLAGVGALIGGVGQAAGSIIGGLGQAGAFGGSNPYDDPALDQY